MKRNRLVLIVLTGVAIVVGSSAAAIHAAGWLNGKDAAPALARERVASDALPATAAIAASEHGLDVSESRKVSDGTYLVPRGESDLCLVGIRGNEMTTGCSPADRFFSSGPINAGVYQEGTPSSGSSVTIAGVAANGVTTVRVTHGNSTSEVPVSDSGGFEVNVTTPDLSDAPTTIIALDASGRTVGSQRLAAN